MRVRLWRWSLLGAIAVVLAIGLAWPERAGAHAVLERSLPVQNQQLAEPPELVETWYSEPLERSFTTLRVLDTQGSPVQTGETLFSDDGRYAAVALPPDLGPGIYTVTYQNVSTVDGHAWSGSFSFVVLNPDGSVPQGTAFQPKGQVGTRQGYLPGVGDSTLRWFGLLASVAIAGVAAFYLLVLRPAADFLRPEEARRVGSAALALAADIVVMAAPVLILSLLGQLFLLADRLGGTETLDDILFDTRTGQLWLSRVGLALALLLLFAPALRSERYRSSDHASIAVALALVGSLGLLITYSLGSHGAAGGGAFWGVGADFAHFVATAAWLGALLQLPLVFWWTRGRLEGPNRLLYLANVFDRFAWLAVISVVLLIGTGVFNGFVELPNFPSLYETTYGRVLIAKLALIVPLLGIAGINAVFLSPALSDAIDALYEEQPERSLGADDERRIEARLHRLQRALPRTIVIELLLGVAVLASVAVLSQTTTAEGELRQAAGKPSGEYATSAEVGDLKVDLSINPFGIGIGTFAVRLAPTAGELGDVLGLRLRAFFDDPNRAPTAGVGGTAQELSATSEPAVWTANVALLTQPGDWRIEARIRRRGEDDSTANFSVPQVGGALAGLGEPEDLFDLPFTFVDWNVVAGGTMVTLGIGTLLIWRKRPPAWQRSTSVSVLASSAFALAAGIVLVFGVQAERETFQKDSPIPPTSESLAIGKDLFERSCMACHGATGEGDGPNAATLALPPPRLGDHVPYHSDGTIFLWVSEGIPLDSDKKNMPSFGSQLSEDERWHLVNYLRATFGSGEFEPVLPEDLARSGQP